MFKIFEIPAGTVRCALVIGVDNPGGLEPLSGAASAASTVTEWLHGEGYDVTLISDADGEKVSTDAIQRALSNYVTSQTYNFLAIYFCGHGYFTKQTGDLWLLSDAHTNPLGTISAMRLALDSEDCGIANVVIVSDACRSTPPPSALGISGVSVFPLQPQPPKQDSTVDKIFSSAKGKASWEADIFKSGKRESVLTHCLMAAYQNPAPGTSKTLQVAGRTISVITNRRLREILPATVVKAFEGAGVPQTQTPQVSIPSGDDVYIARAAAEPSTAGATTDRPFIAAASMTGRPRATAKGWRPEELIIPSVAKLDTGTGVAIRGRSVRLVMPFEPQTISQTILGRSSGITVRAGGEYANVALPLKGSGTLAIQFENGQGALLPYLDGFITHVVAGSAGIDSVRFVPSKNAWMYRAYEKNAEKIASIHADITSTARHGWFDMPLSADQATQLAGIVREAKAADPTLGIFACYLYRFAGLRDGQSKSGKARRKTSQSHVREITEILRKQLGVGFFDCLLLGRALAPYTSRGQMVPLVPLCPMLTQGWALLAPNASELPLVLQDARKDLLPSLWTTFKARRMEKIVKAIEMGDLR